MSKNHNPYYSRELAAPLDSQWATRRKITAQLRRIGEYLLAGDIDDELLQDLEQDLQRQADALAATVSGQGRIQHMDSSSGVLLDDVAVVDYEVSPLSGQCNLIAPPMHVWYEEDCVRAEVELGWQYEGPPGCVHGGMVAAMFDQLLGLGQSLTDNPGVTGTLTVKYHDKTPLNRALTMKGWVDRVEGRKNILCAELWAGDSRTASCEGVFIRIDHRKWNLTS